MWINHDSDLGDVGLQSSAGSGPAATPAATLASSTPSHGKQLMAASLGLAAALAISGHVSASTAQSAHTAASRTTTAATETIHTTANHPWLTADRGWAEAGNLRPSEQVVTQANPDSSSRRRLRG